MFFSTSLITSLTSKICALLCYLPLLLMGLIGLCILVVFHELGHLIFAKMFNIYVPSFSVGFGPRIIEKKIGETTFAISAIPLGGYVELAGAPEVGQGEQLHASRTDERSFNQKPYWQKMFVMIGGILFNVIFSYTALSGLLYFGSPCIGSWCSKYPATIGTVIPGKAADKAGLKSGDTVIAINNNKIESIKNFTDNLQDFIEKEVSIAVLRNNKEENVMLISEAQKSGSKTSPLIGVLWNTKPLPLFQALKQGWEATWSMMVEVAGAIKGLTKNRDGLGGPLILITTLTQFAQQGFKTFLFFLALISVNLAVFNFLPLPIFDGGQMLFYTIEAITGKPLSEKTREKIFQYTWILLIILLVYLTIGDSMTIFKSLTNK